MLDLLGKRLGCPGEVVLTEALQFLFAVEWALVFRFTTCTDAKTSMAKMPWNFAPRDGKVLPSRILDGRTCLFMEAQDFVSVVSSFLESIVPAFINTDQSEEDFALMEASCAIIRLLQKFPQIRLPTEHPMVMTGQEKQELTVFLKSADGCKVLLS